MALIEYSFLFWYKNCMLNFWSSADPSFSINFMTLNPGGGGDSGVQKILIQQWLWTKGRQFLLNRHFSGSKPKFFHAISDFPISEGKFIWQKLTTDSKSPESSSCISRAFVEVKIDDLEHLDKGDIYQKLNVFDHFCQKRATIWDFPIPDPCRSNTNDKNNWIF